MLYFDPGYWMVIGLGMLLSFWASSRVKRAFRRYSQIPSRSGMSGAEIASRILADSGIRDVRIEPVAGSLSDHYDPQTKTLRLSEDVYESRSLAAFGVAAHEAGHAIQHAEGYRPLAFRSAWVPVASTGSGISMFVIFAALLMGGVATSLGATLAWLGIGLFATTTVFTLVTLPVEFDASRRALACLEGRYMGADEIGAAREVLRAAGLTYVAAFATSLLTLLYWAMHLGLFGRSED